VAKKSYANDFRILWRSRAQKNYENPSIYFVKVAAKKSVAHFVCGHGVYVYFIYVAIVIRF